MKSHQIFLAAVLIVLPLCCPLWALPTTAYDAEKVVAGWLKADSQPLGASLGRQVLKVETFMDEDAEPLYYIVFLQPSGFVIVAADNQVEPIIGFADNGAYDPSPANPLWALVTQDLNGRIAAVRQSIGPLAAIPPTVKIREQQKWDGLIGLANISDDEIRLMGRPAISEGILSDLRVPPLLKSLWGQRCCNGPDNEPLACYNYFMPNVRGWSAEGDPNNYPCGCVATTMAQLMHFHRHPSAPVEPATFTVVVDGCQIDRSLLRGEGPGGAYDWEDMVDEPGPNTTDKQRRAIGALCHDAGVSVYMQYTQEGSGAYLYDAAIAFVRTFQYSQAVWGETGDTFTWRQGLLEMMNPNLDANLPVLLGIRDRERPWRGHTAVCDGYGYNLLTPYHHLNMGWDGQENCWYNLPDINCPTAAGYDVITECIYNIFPEGSVEIISGRIIDSQGEPLRGISVTARSESDTEVHTTVTNSRGIYALRNLSSNTTYVLTASQPGYDFEINAGYRSDPSQVVTGLSLPGNTPPGNRWGVNFVGYPNGGGESQVVCSDVKLVAADTERNDHFGCSVSVSGDYAIVGAYGDDSNRGAAYIFKREGAAWIQQAKLTRPVPRKRDSYFGFSVSISRDYAIVGAYRDDDCGCAYVFKREGISWALQDKLVISEGRVGDSFGYSTAISEGYAIVGAPCHGRNSGWAFTYLFKREGVSWIQQAKLIASDGYWGDYFGDSVSISGNYAIASTEFGRAYGQMSGSAYILTREGTSWTHQSKLIASDGSVGDSFGHSVSICGNYAISGAPEEDNDNGKDSGAAYVFKRVEASWTEQAKLTALDGLSGDHFGHSVSLDGEYIIVGAPGDTVDYAGMNSGSAYIFKHDQASWTQQAKLTAMDGAYNDFFGNSVSINGDYVIIGAPKNDVKGEDSGAAYIFKRIGSTWSP